MNTNYKTGLSNSEVIKSRKEHGSNKLTMKKRNTFFKLVLDALGDPIIKILIIALVIKVIFLFKDSNIYETLGIAIAVFLAAFISALSEYGSEKAFEKLNSENQTLKTKVIRNSNKIIIDIEDVVVGDIICLESGDRIPSDGIIVSGYIDVDESSLTGESKEVHKLTKNNVFKGSIVNNGNCIIRATSVGDNTYYGSIASLVQETSLDSPLKIRLRGLASTISKLGYIAAFIILISYMFNVVVVKNNFDINKILAFKDFFPHLIYALTLSVAVVVMSVPEGLPLLVTLVLSSNMKRMIKSNVLVRKLVGIETAGSLNILFTDKTGTLTEGKLKVSNYITPDNKTYNNFSSIDSSIKEIIYQSLVYNNDSFLNKGVAEAGNSTDKSILEFVNNDDRNKYVINNIIHFDSSKKYSLVETNYSGGTIFIKGASEIIINKCSYTLENNKKRLLYDKNKYIDIVKEYTKSGYRVLALAYKSVNEESYTYLGLILIKDNIRKNAFKGIERIKNAGINVVMVTGDSYETACSVATNLKIIDSSSDIILTSEEFNNMSENDIKRILPNLKVLCRSLPQDKNKLVRLSQELDLIVGMTGDGVNDAPALKRADVGFSMGSGTEVAKETSDIVIINNDINSIASAILYGRTIFKSIRKFVIFQLTVNVCAVLLSVIGPFIGVLTPITVIQVLWVNMVMDTFAGFAFAFEPALEEYMEEKPKERKEPILNKYMINQIIFNGLYSFVICVWFLKSKLISNIYRLDYSNKYLYSAFFGLFIFLAIFNAFNARTHRINILSNILKNKVFLSIIFLIVFIQVIIMYYGGELFRTTGLTIYEFEIMLLIAFTIVPFDMLRKFILKKRKMERSV